MKKLYLFFLFSLCPVVGFSAQQPITSVPQPADGKMGTLRAAINAQLGNSQANFVELYAANSSLTTALNGKAATTCFANNSALAACFPSLSMGGATIDDQETGIGVVWSAAKITSELTGKQASLGFIPENASNKGTANGYASLGSDGLVPSSQLPPSTGTDDQTATEVPATAWGSYTGTNVQVLMQEVDTALRALVSGAALPSWMPSVGPTNGRQILQATGGCTLSAYDNQADCETNSGTWTTPTYQHTSMILGLINDSGTADDDLWSAAKITSELAGKQSADVDLTTWAGVTPGTGVATALGGATGSVGGVSTIIASGTKTLATDAIPANSCATLETATATGTATTDVIIATPNARLSTIAGYGVTTAGALRIDVYPTENTVNFEVCNPTSTAITTAAVTVNWKVIR